MGKRRDYCELDVVRSVTFSTHDKLHLLKRRECAAIVRDSLYDCKVRLGFELYAYAIMSNHIHFIFALRDEPIELAKILMLAKNGSARKILPIIEDKEPELYAATRVLKSGKVGHRVWMAGGGYDQSLSTPEAVFGAVEYIHNNPVKAGLCATQRDFEFSSAFDIESGRYEIVDPLPVR